MTEFHEVADMLGKTIASITGMSKGSDSIVFLSSTGESYELYHVRDYETVEVEDVIGDPDDLIGEPLLMAEESSNQEYFEHGDSQTWTFYKFATIKGYVTIRWLGRSNGYYSETVDFRVIPPLESKP